MQTAMADDTLKSKLHAAGLTRGAQLLMLLGATGGVPLAVSDVRSQAIACGVRGAKTWDISTGLSRLRGKAIRTPHGWELTDAGRAEAAALLGVSPTAQPASALRLLLSRISKPEVREFVQEAVSCCEANHYRAAVVLSWVGAVALLYDQVLRSHLPAFNTEASRRDARWKAARTGDDLARMKEGDFLNTLESLSVLGKSVKAELEGCLKLRNACGHPNSLRISAHRVAAHIEVLCLNVFDRFA